MPGIACCIHDSHGYVVHDAEQDSEGVYPEVGDRALHYVRRGSHPTQDSGCKQYPEDGKKQTGHKAESQIRMDGFPEPLVVSGSEVFGDYDSCSDCKAVEEADHHEDQASGGCHACQGLRPECVADNQRVGSIVELLEKVSQKERK